MTQEPVGELKGLALCEAVAECMGLKWNRDMGYYYRPGKKQMWTTFRPDVYGNQEREVRGEAYRRGLTHRISSEVSFLEYATDAEFVVVFLRAFVDACRAEKENSNE